MSMSDLLGDMLTRIRNGQSANLKIVRCPASKLRLNVLDVLKDEGYILGYKTEEVRSGITEVIIELKYHEGNAVIREVKRVSKPGRRVYSKIKDLKRVYNGLGIFILTTPRGVISDVSARNLNVGGEVICQVF